MLSIFVTATLGGTGSIYGVIADGPVIGLTMSMPALRTPSVLSRVATLIVMIAILLVKSSGLFSGRVTA